MKTNLRYTLIKLLLIAALFYGCAEEYQQPYSELIPASQSGLNGQWAGTTLTKDFAKILLDSLGNAVTDDKGRTVWYDTSVTVGADSWKEYLEFLSVERIDTFTINTSIDSLNAGVLMPVINMPVDAGYWSVSKVINPEGEKDDVTTITFYDPADPHNSLSSIIWTIKEQSTNEFTIQYSFGSTTFDTLFTKTFQKL
jgi:hypothetical protein